MGRRYGGYGRYNSNYREESWGGHLEVFPKFKIVCESENHIGYINVPPKLAYQNPQGYAQIDAELYKISKIRISYIQMIEKSGITSYAYRRPSDIKPESDMGWHGIVKVGHNRKNILHLFVEKLAGDSTDLLCAFLRKFFSDPSGLAELGGFSVESSSGDDVGKRLQKEKHHSRYSLPHKEASASPIEKLFRDELIRNGIQFEEQVEIILEDKKFSVPDFVVGSAGLMIYCDGTEFHKDPQRIIMDKQQDRVLQTQGFNVFRFSGSEIAADVKKCVREVQAFIAKRKG
ncbi:MAG: hypothetical protein CVV41_18080 [Candidatus Riflebacteria bacterium HGW-Riflebacteria-1]|jgi:very-short-patch-repair endonuclease|nr:MAG: hypothetical protein CVV41_18080 [Candidatus Riflebacteria bacterium HGW-Riflebacteria-1]